MRKWWYARGHDPADAKKFVQGPGSERGTAQARQCKGQDAQIGVIVWKKGYGDKGPAAIVRGTGEDSACCRECNEGNSLDQARSIDGHDFVALGHRVATLFDPCEQVIAHAQRVCHHRQSRIYRTYAREKAGIDHVEVV